LYGHWEDADDDWICSVEENAHGVHLLSENTGRGALQGVP
jgi:hypothetical protein